jgi:enoyl-CoA hydratase/carnithine racemase
MSVSLGRDTAPVSYEVVDRHVAMVTLNRPEKSNAVNGDVARAVAEALGRTEADPEVRVVLLAAVGRAFCAGADLAAVSEGRAQGIQTPDGFAGFTYAPRTRPWIAVVEGPAVAGGLEVCLACDMIVASTTARFGVPEVKRGLLAGDGGAHRLPQRIPRNVALEMIATGDPISAARAAELGLVNRLVQPGEALAAARELAGAIAANAPLAVRHSLDIARRSAGADDVQGRALSHAALAALRGTEDWKEGPRAFVEKRAPVWVGR